MIYKIVNANIGITEYFDTKAEAEARVEELAQNILDRESYRFSISKVTVEGPNTTWSAADLENDPEIGNYKVFVHTTGQYEDFSSLTNAKARLQALKEEFVLPFKNIEELAEMPTLVDGVEAIPTETM